MINTLHCYKVSFSLLNQFVDSIFASSTPKRRKSGKAYGVGQHLFSSPETLLKYEEKREIEGIYNEHKKGQKMFFKEERKCS